MFANSKTFLPVICLLGIMTISVGTTQVTNLKDDIEKLSLYTYRTIEDAIQIYCKQVPIMLTSCDQFIARVTNKTAIHLPHLILPQKIDVNDEKTLNNVLANTFVTINDYLILVERELKQEKRIACQAATAIGVECHYPRRCRDISNGDSVIFYCKLHYVHAFLNNFKIFLDVMVPDSMASKMVTDDRTDLRMKIFIPIFRRWYTMIILKSTLTQISTFRKVMTHS